MSLLVIQCRSCGRASHGLRQPKSSVELTDNRVCVRCPCPQRSSQLWAAGSCPPGEVPGRRQHARSPAPNSEKGGYEFLAATCCPRPSGQALLGSPRQRCPGSPQPEPRPGGDIGPRRVNVPAGPIATPSPCEEGPKAWFVHLETHTEKQKQWLLCCHSPGHKLQKHSCPRFSPRQGEDG